jgi:hypothetical protein
MCEKREKEWWRKGESERERGKSIGEARCGEISVRKQVKQIEKRNLKYGQIFWCDIWRSKGTGQQGVAVF